MLIKNNLLIPNEDKCCNEFFNSDSISFDLKTLNFVNNLDRSFINYCPICGENLYEQYLKYIDDYTTKRSLTSTIIVPKYYTPSIPDMTNKLFELFTSNYPLHIKNIDFKHIN